MLENYQWKITDYGLETHNSNDEYFTEYAIEAANLYELIEFDDICIFRAMLPLLGREWVISDDIIEIYPYALDFHSQRIAKKIEKAKITIALETFKLNDTWLKARELKSRLAELI